MRRLMHGAGLLPVTVVCGCVLPAWAQSVSDPAATHQIPSFVVPAPQSGVTYERFIVIGDHGNGKPGQKQVAAAMVKRARSDGLDFVLTVGDNIYPKGVKSTADPQWRTKFEEVYADPVLQLLIYPTLGNHDHYGTPQAQIDYAGHNKNWKMADFYYSFVRTLADGTKVAFFAIDSDPIHESKPDAASQLAWLDEALGKADAQWKIVFGHHTLYGHNPRRGHNQTMINKLEPLFVKHKVDVYFAGHDHSLEMFKPIKGVHYVISGAAGGPEWAYAVNWTDESFYVATLGGFVLCRICKDELVIEFVRLDGKTQYAHVLRK